MTVKTYHKQYEDNRAKWKRCRDVIDGRDSIVENGRVRQRFVGSLFNPIGTADVYLPRLSGQTEAEYQAYAERAGFFNATGRTIDAMTGMIFAKDPHWNLPPAIEPYTRDITLTAINLREFSEQVVEQQMAVGRVGIMVDYPETPVGGMSLADAERNNVRPFMRLYKAESIINWRSKTVNGAVGLTLVVLQETAEVRKSEFEFEDVIRYRVLDLTPDGYRVRVMDEDNVVLSEVYPKVSGRPMMFIPFLILGSNSCDPAVQKPPMIDLVDTNLAHYRNSADYEHGLHFTGLPTPYVAGVQIEAGETLSIGSNAAWVFPDPQASAAYLEFKGEGLKTLADAIMAKEQRMAVLGARMLVEERKSAESFRTVEMRSSGERSVLSSISRSASDAMVRALNWMAEWAGAPSDCEFALNTDFSTNKMDANMLTAMVSAYQTGVMPLQVLFDNFKRGELVSQGTDYETYEAQLADSGPTLVQPAQNQPPVA